MSMSREIFFKDHVNDARVPAEARNGAREGKAEHEYLGPVFEKGFIVTPDSRGGPPAGSADLCVFAYTTPAQWQRAPRVQDVVASIERGKERVVETIGSALGARFRDIRKGLEKKIAAVDNRATAADKEIATLRAEISELKGQVAALAGENKALLSLAKRAPPAALPIMDWDIDSSNAIAVPMMSDGTKAAPLGLLGLFTSLAARFAEVDRPKRARAPRANEVA
jgi:hypothetical protein